MDKLNIQFTLFSAFYSPLIATMSGGFLKEEGLDFDWSVAKPGVSAIEALKDGSAQVIQTAPSQAFTSLKNKEEPIAVHFAQVNEMDGFFVAGRTRDLEFSWKKLEGSEVVMFKGGQPNAMFRYACHKAGIDYDKIIPITPGGAEELDKAFRDGEGQYIVQQGPYPQQLEVESIGYIVAQVGPQIGPCAFSSLAATKEWLATVEAKAFTRAYGRARRYMNDSAAEDIAESQQSFFPDISLEALEVCIASYQLLGNWSPHIEITEAAYETTLDVFEYTGSLTERYPYNRVCSAPPFLRKR